MCGVVSCGVGVGVGVVPSAVAVVGRRHWDMYDNPTGQGPRESVPHCNPYSRGPRKADSFKGFGIYLNVLLKFPKTLKIFKKFHFEFEKYFDDKDPKQKKKNTSALKQRS